VSDTALTVGLTDWDRSLLSRHLKFYESLASGKRPPTTPAQEHFVRVIMGEARPQTQHEIAYSRYLAASETGDKKLAAIDPGAEISTAPSTEIEQTIDAIEEVQLTHDSSGRFRKAFERIKESYKSGTTSVRERSSQAALWMATLTSEAEWARQVERWSADQFNTLSNVYTQAMDGKFLSEGLGTPLSHRLVDGGHTLGGSWEAARSALQDDTFWQELRGWGGAFASDLSSVVGMPITTLSAESLEYLEGALSSLGVSKSDLVDALSVNAVELASTVVPLLGAILNWSEPDRKDFAQMIGASGLAAIVSANPVLFLVSVVCAARAFHHQRHKHEGVKEWAKSVASGGALSGLVLATSSVVAGPVWVGVVAGILAVIVLKRAGDSAEALRLVGIFRKTLMNGPRLVVG